MFKALFVLLACLQIQSSFAAAVEFKVAHDGEVTALFVGHSAVYENIVGVHFSDMPSISEIVPMSNHSTIGQAFDLGYHEAGTIVTFYDHVVDTGNVWSSDIGSNNDGISHIMYQNMTHDTGMPSMMIGFEDLRLGGDHDFNDAVFGMVNVVPAVPEPETYAMMLIGLGLVGYLNRRRMAKCNL